MPRPWAILSLILVLCSIVTDNTAFGLSKTLPSYLKSEKKRALSAEQPGEELAPVADEPPVADAPIDDTPVAEPIMVADSPVEDTSPVSAPAAVPVTPPTVAPIAAPVTAPVTAPVEPPVQPPTTAPVEAPIEPISPPEEPSSGWVTILVMVLTASTFGLLLALFACIFCRGDSSDRAQVDLEERRNLLDNDHK